MALRNGSAKGINRFRGHNSTDNLENIAAEFWSDSINMVVNSKGSAEVLRSPKAFNAAITTSPVGNKVLSLADYLNPTEHRVLFDINLSTGSNVATYKIEDDFSNTSLRTGQHDKPFVSLVVNQQLYRINKYEFIQHCAPVSGFASWDVFSVGVAAPVAAPTISYQSGGTGAILVSVNVSYAYMNSRTGEVSNASPTSNTLGASGASKKIRVPVVASAQHGVDKLVFFFTLDDGSERFLIIDGSANPVTQTNATTNYDFDIGTLAWDTLTPETVYNNLPPAGGNFVWQWKDKLFVAGFDGTVIPFTDVAYSALEACYIGIPQSCFPDLNRLSAAGKGEIMAGGIGTQQGNLMMSDIDSYLLEGFPSDKTSGPEASTAVSEVLLPLNWQIGTKSPRTIRNTQFGTIWLDQILRLRLWSGQGAPEEVALPIRGELADLDLTTLDTCVGQWYQFSDDGGVYLLTGKSTASGKYRAFMVSIYQDPASGAQMTGYGISDIETQDLAPVYVNGALRLFIGGAKRLFTFLQSSQAGDGWPNGTNLYFEIVIGNENNFQYFHSLSFDATVDLTKLTVTVRDVTKDANGNAVAEATGNARTLTPELADEGGGAAYSLIDEYGRRKVIRFAFNNSDSATGARKIKNVRIVYANKKRLL